MLNELNRHVGSPDNASPPLGDRIQTLVSTAPASEQETNYSLGNGGQPDFATREDLAIKPTLDKKRLILLGGVLAAAALVFGLAAIVGKSPKKRSQIQTAQQTQSQTPARPKGSMTPVMDTVRKPSPENSDGQLAPGDIKRTQTADGTAPGDSPSAAVKGPAKVQAPNAASLGSVPSFSDTQQKWEEPRPYGEKTEPTPTATQSQQASLKEPSLIFVRSQPQQSAVSKSSETIDDVPVLDMVPGTRILAKLQTEISSADPTPVVAVVQHTYAIGNQVIVPAGALIFGQLSHADVSGYVGVKFDEIQLADGPKEKIEAVGKALDLGPIKGTVTGKNTGRNFAIRAASGIGSVAAMLVGNNTSSSFSEDDLLRERIAQNIGNAGDSELLSLNATSRVVVSVPADREIYVVFTKHVQTPATLKQPVTQ
jgi:hypothetical protein